jgi:hypothetical protein
LVISDYFAWRSIVSLIIGLKHNRLGTFRVTAETLGETIVAIKKRGGSLEIQARIKGIGNGKVQSLKLFYADPTQSNPDILTVRDE